MPQARFLPYLITFTITSSIAFAVTTDIDVLYSEVMDKSVNYRVVLPDSYATETEKTFPVLYALHGAGSSEEPWSVMYPLNSAIDGDYPAIIVTFKGDASYIDHPSDPSIQYTTFFFDELVPFIENNYRAGGRPGLRAVTGFSMGGYGAWHYMLEKPEFFSSVSALSGAFDRDPAGESKWNPFNQIPEMAAKEIELPPTYMNCGSLDTRWLNHSVRMETTLKENGYDTIFIETEGAGHDWPFWRDTSLDVIKFHYEHFTDADLWRGAEIVGTTVQSDPFGWVDISVAPWLWATSSQRWFYVSEEWTPQNGGWAYLYR